MKERHSIFWQTSEKILGRFSPATVALAVFTILLGLTAGLRFLNHSKAQPEFDVYYQTKQNNFKANYTKENETTANSPSLADPNVRYAERLREATSLGMGLSIAVLHERLKEKRRADSLIEIVSLAKKRELFPPNLQFDTQGLFAYSNLGAYYLRYRSAPFGLEIVSVGRQGEIDGEVFVLRIPDESGQKITAVESVPQAAFASLWISPSDSTALPSAFAPASFYKQAGWRLEILRSGEISPEKFAELNNWLRNAAKD